MAPVARDKPIEGVVFDGDDTLWWTEQLYDAARTSTRLVVEDAGLSGECWEKAQRERDLVNVALMGFAPARFPKSSMEALALVAADAGRAVSPEVELAVRSAAESVFTAVAPLRSDALVAVRSLVDRGYRVGLLTKGDTAVQERRVSDSGLRPFFDPIVITSSKTPRSFQRIAAGWGLHESQVAAVGNSIPSDIVPSHDAGMTAIWLPAHVWEYESRNHSELPDGVATVSSLMEVVGFVERRNSERNSFTV